MKNLKEKKEKDGRDEKKAENKKLIKKKELLSSDGINRSKRTEKFKEKLLDLNKNTDVATASNS